MIKYIKIYSFIFLFFVGCSVTESDEMKVLAASSTNKGLQTATFAGGCYWCMEAAFEKLDGPKDVTSGYAEGKGVTHKIEAIQVSFDPMVISYVELLDYYWRQFDPTDKGGSFYDRGPEYESYIFYHDDNQQKLANQSKQELQKSGLFTKPVVTEIVEFEKFKPVQESEQDFYQKNPERYYSYRKASGRDEFIEGVWCLYKMEKYQKPSPAEIRKKLTDLQYAITQEDATERAFDNAYWDNKKEGIYVDIVSGEPLFSSSTKFKSGTGWPSFTKPIDPYYIVRKGDRTFIEERIEVRSRIGNSHLGHVFYDGPPPSYLRYCLNSAALKFIPREKMQEKGYGDYLWVFNIQ